MALPPGTEKLDSRPHSPRDHFRRFAVNASKVLGSAWAFLIAMALIVIWAVLGPFLHFSDTWQLLINSLSAIVTFLMVFLIQNTQNRDAKAIHLKLDELIRAVDGARNHLVDLEKLSDEELDRMEREFHRLHRLADRMKQETGEEQTQPVHPNDC